MERLALVGIVHRDVRPDHVMVVRGTQRFVLIDLGSAVMIGTLCIYQGMSSDD